VVLQIALGSLLRLLDSLVRLLGLSNRSERAGEVNILPASPVRHFEDERKTVGIGRSS